jgi:F0F1-type ATP synthase gamma subunit
MVQATNIHKIYEKVHVLNGVNLVVNKGEIISIVGESGAGKTTLLNIIGTLIKPSKNFKSTLIINNIDVNSLSDNDLSKFRNKSLGFIFQFHQVMAIGKKANDSLSKEFKIVSNESKIFDDLNFTNVAQIAQILMNKFKDGSVDKIELVYNKFKNAATQIVTTEQFLPIVTSNDQINNNQDYIFEPSKVEIVKTLIPKSLKTQLFKAIRDSFASEHGARMTAMHKATDNATELRDQLKLTYNKARQAAITNEILEIVGGAEALNS